MFRSIIVIAISLLSSVAFAEEIQRGPQENLIESARDTEELPSDFAEIHRALDAEALRRTSKHLLEQSFEIEMRETEARVTLRNPKTGKKEMFRVARAGGGCC